MKIYQNIIELIGNTPVIRIRSLSERTGCHILLKCENFNPGGTIKDRAALSMVLEAEKRGMIKKGDTLVEGTAGNTGIGLALVAKALGYKMLVVMPKEQSPAKEALIKLYGAEIVFKNPVPFANPEHFYHTAKSLAEAQKNHWWVNQFENLDNFKTHYETTGPEIYKQTDNGDLDFLVAASGTGGTIGGTSSYLKEKIKKLKVILVDPNGSGLYSYFKENKFVMSGSSMTEGIGIMRLTQNFAQAKIDDALRIDDQALVDMAYHVRDKDGILLGMSSALNVAAAYKIALENRDSGKKILTFLCDGGERATTKLYNEIYLKEKNLSIGALI
ncbi:MAG: cysteine synthase A [Bacteriovoracaceae bacterium]